MADFTALKTAIQTYIKQNGNEEITGERLQEILLSMVTTLGDSAINDLITALNDEVAARQNADGTLQQNITNEATARGNADTALSSRLGSTITAENTAADQIGAEAETRAAADTALQELIDGITDNIENGYVYAGIATPSSTPATGKVFYLALTAGTYTNFGNTEVSQGINILKYNGSAWLLDAFIGIDDELTPGSNKLPKSGNVLENIIKNGSAFDLSAYNAEGGVLATYADLDAALTALNALPSVYKQPGMSFRFVRTSDNKYVQARLMSQSFTTDIDSWQVIDNAIKAGSENIAKSGDVAENLKAIQKVELAVTEHGKYIDLSGGVGTAAPVDSPTDFATYNYILYPVAEDDIVTINGVGGVAPRLWAFLDSSNIILQVAEEGAHATDLVKTAPNNAAFIVINNSSDSKCYIERGNSLSQRYKKNSLQLGSIDLSRKETNVIIGGSGKWTTYSDYKSIAIPVAPSSNYRITANNIGFTSFCFLSEEPSYVIGDDVPFAEGYDRVLVISASMSKIVVSPKDAKYIYFLTYGNGQVVLPQALESISQYEQGRNEIPLINGAYIDLSGGIGTVAPIDSPTQLPAYNYGIYPCTSDDYVNISGSGGIAPRLWAFLDDSNIILQVADSNTDVNNLIMKVPANATKIVINTTRSKSYVISNGGLSYEFTKAESEFSNKKSVNFATIPTSLKLISGAGKWVELGDRYASKFIEVEEGQDLFIYNNGDTIADFALITSIGEVGDDVSYATGCSRETVNAGESAVVNVPSDAHYLYTTVLVNLEQRSISVEVYNANKKLSVSSIVDNIHTPAPNAPLSAKQGVVLRNKANGPRKVYVAASDSPDEEKLMADFLCNGTNDELVIQKAVDSLIYGGTVQLLDGTFNIDSFPYSVNVYDDKTQTTTHIEHVAIYFKDINNGDARTVNIIGSTENKSYNSAYGTNIRVSDAAIDAMNDTDIYDCFMGASVHPTQYGDYTWVTNANFENFNLYINDAQKKIIGINCMFFGGTRMKFVDIKTKSTTENRLNHRPPVTPAIGSIGIVMNSGSNDAIGCGFENVICEGMYIGFMFHDIYYGASLDHLVMINCGASQCVYGFYFKSGTNKTLTLINCYDEACTHLPYFGGEGHITAIDTCIERFNSEYYPEDLAGSTEFYAQEETPGSWIGTIEFTLQGWSGADEGLTGQHFWKDGHGHGIRTRNLNYDHKGYTYPNCGEYLEQYFERTTNKWMTWNGTAWV